MSELVSLSYTSLRDDMDKNIDKLDGTIKQLRAMGTLFEESLAIRIIVASINVPVLSPATVASKTLADKDFNWKDISARLIDEAKISNMGQ